jgi:hypothetical protein
MRLKSIGFQQIFLEQTIYAVMWAAKSITFPATEATDYDLPMNLGHRVELEDFRRIIPVGAL